MTDTTRRAFLRGGFFRDLVRTDIEPQREKGAVEPSLRREEGEAEEQVTMPWERPSRRPSASDGPRRPAVAGTFEIARDKCLVYRGTTCSVCRERCPIAGCITLVEQRPVIASALCDGCGLCVSGCPAPVLAIRFVPGRSS